MNLWRKLAAPFSRDVRPEHLQRGDRGEHAAREYLRRAGLKFLTANFRSPRGEIDLDNAYLIREEVDRVLVRNAAKKIVVDLGGVTLIDSVGIGVMVACYHAATAYRVSLEATNPSTMVYRQLWVSGLVGLFGLATPRPDADAVAGHP